MKPAGRVDDDDVVLVAARVIDAQPSRSQPAAAPGGGAKYAAPTWPASRSSCVIAAGRYTSDAREQRLAPVLLDEVARELRGGRRLARALQPREQHDDRRRRMQVETAARLAHDARQFLMDHADERLARRQALA